MAGITYRREIDGLRAIAVLAVVLYHAVDMPRSGFVGVDIFFVISGYLITALLLREHERTGGIDFAAFYARRVRRILPAALTVTLAVLVSVGELLPRDATTRTAYSAAAAAAFGANIFFQSVTGGYFAPRAEEMPLLHLWSLSVEEQFYLLWPALLVLLLRWRPAATLKVLCVLAIVSFVLAEWLTYVNSQAAFYQMPARFWELALGGGIAFLPASGTAHPRMAATSLAAVVATCFISMPHFPATGALPVVMATVVLLWTIHQGNELGIAGSVLRSPPMVGLGLISYSLYLWHWPLLAIYRANSIGSGSALVRLSLCALAVLLSIASYRYIEQPLRRKRWPSKRLLAWGATVSVATTLAACTYGYQSQFNKIDNPDAIRVENDTPPAGGHCRAGLYSPVPLRDDCQVIDGRAVSIVLWGDSMAYAWEPLSDRLGQEEQRAAMDYSRAGCGPFLVIPEDSPRQADDKCRTWNAGVVERASRANTVILVAQWSAYLTPNGELRDMLHDTLVRLSAVPNVLIIGPTPEMHDTVARCLRNDDLAACAMSRAEYDTYASPLLSELRAAAVGMQNVHVIDMSTFFCNESECPPMMDGYSLYWDSHHVSYTAAKAYASQYAEKIAELEENRSYKSRRGAGG